MDYDKALGALLGVHAGDSLGATLEFRSHASIKREYPTGLRDIIGGGGFNWAPGAATDDTDLTRAVLLAYVSRETSDNKEDFSIVRASANNSLQWLEGNWPQRKPGEPPIDIGGATNIGLRNYKRTLNPYTSGAGENSAGNGSLMRCIPTALFTSDPEQRMKESIEISQITHNDKRCTISCAAYNEIVAALLRGTSVQAAVNIGKEVADKFDCPAVREAIERGEKLSISTIAEKGPGSELPDKTSGYVLQSLSVAIAAVLDERGLEDVLVDVVRIGGDTDTNGAIAGGLLGARDGLEEGIPERWLDVLQFRKEFMDSTSRILMVQSGL